jgi:transcriptional regulator with XRE-family HTH domain
MAGRKAYIANGLGERIRRLRRERGWTQLQLAERVGCSKRAIVYYEGTAKFPPAPILAAMAGAFGIDVQSLMSPEEPTRVASRRDDPDLLNDPMDRRLWKKVRLIKALPERDQVMIIRMINSLSGVVED